jgi:hypothetical protein
MKGSDRFYSLGRAIAYPTHQPPTQNEQKKKDNRIDQTLRLPAKTHKQLKYLATDLEKPMHDLLIEKQPNSERAGSRLPTIKKVLELR